MAEKVTLGYIPCPWCRDLWQRDALATVRENSKGKLFVVCEGGADHDRLNCGQGNNLHARHSAHLKALIAKAARGAPESPAAVEPAQAPQPDQAPTETTDDGKSSTDDPAGEPQPDPETDGNTGSGFGLL